MVRIPSITCIAFACLASFTHGNAEQIKRGQRQYSLTFRSLAPSTTARDSAGVLEQRDLPQVCKWATVGTLGIGVPVTVALLLRHHWINKTRDLDRDRIALL
ncbi:hypothetical protein CF327_g5816 [Tilletia walkeri]|nr:hypothetical protein CF327_g5816 [Tilletia walkeri]